MKNGTKKQIAWAEKIKKNILEGPNPAMHTGMYASVATREARILAREQKIAAGEWEGERLEKRKNSLEIKKQELAILKNAVAYVENCDNAVWFIENRGELDAFIPIHDDMRVFNRLFV